MEIQSREQKVFISQHGRIFLFHLKMGFQILIFRRRNHSPVNSDSKVPLRVGEKGIARNLKVVEGKMLDDRLLRPGADTWSFIDKDLLPLLYSLLSSPLATSMHSLQVRKMAIGLQISEPWLREYQVLPSRTHPCMQMSGCGGYILSGTRTATNASSQQ
ncbi:hypothetical protein CUMW_279560 [Citrus unshiu]|uniref:tRNA (adenine(58)-N(1))-methyltransferase non-catalytic subunit TRM6 n=1 Tax=Citrus unshiu TaxID=55188 RepID=A0A2H5N7W4_CITUN|nr:hypothetical protein CUMW_279560 [Citrus unshiu]